MRVTRRWIVYCMKRISLLTNFGQIHVGYPRSILVTPLVGSDSHQCLYTHSSHCVRYKCNNCRDYHENHSTSSWVILPKISHSMQKYIQSSWNFQQSKVFMSLLYGNKIQHPLCFSSQNIDLIVEFSTLIPSCSCASY